MKKFLTTVMVLAMILGMTAVVYADGVNVTIEGVPVEFPGGQGPVIVDGRTLVPVRGVFEMLGFEVKWDGDARVATLTSDEHEVVITIDSADFYTDGELQRPLDVPAQIIGGRTMVPIRFPLNSVGFNVDWDNETRTVLISEIPVVFVEIGGQMFNAELTFIELNTPELLADLEKVNQMEKLTGLSVWEATDEHLEIIKTMNHLTYLSLIRSSIEDVSTLLALTNLENLVMMRCDIEDAAPFAAFTNLVSLNLSVNAISDLTPLAGLTNLTRLALNDNRISDLTPLVGLTNLRTLMVDDNEITDITPLRSMENLSGVSLEGNTISDWSPVDHIETVIGR